MLLHPNVSGRDCRHCWIYQYDEETGKPRMHHGQPLRRVKGLGPPCCYRDKDGKSKCPKGSINDYPDLTMQNLKALYHYRSCKAVGQFPDDEIVRRNATIIASVEDAADRINQHQNQMFARSMSMNRA